MWSVLTETLGILNESAIYLLFGFALAGVLHVALRRVPAFTDQLAARGTKSVILAALFGAPLPLCSCSVVPAGLTLRRKGASKGATVSFLISCPETDVVSILLTYGLLGPLMAVVRPLAAVVTAIVAGLAVNLVERGVHQEPSAEDAAGNNACDCHEEADYDPSKGAAWNAAHYGFVRFFDDIIGSLILGMVVGGLITAILPQIGIERLPGGSFLTMLIMLGIGIPMYVCASASTPIAAGMIAGGVSPGAALVFLLAGPATNIGSLMVLRKYLGRAVLVTYLVCIAVVSLGMGLWLDAAFAPSVIVPKLAEAAAAEQGPGAIKLGGGIILLVLTLLSFRRVGLLANVLQRVNRLTGLRLGPRSVKIAAIVLAVVAYVCSGFFIVGPGERGVIRTFGRIERSYLPPGLYYRWPYPIGRGDVVSVGTVRWIELGFRRSIGSAEGDKAAASAARWQIPSVSEALAADGVRADLAAESWMLTGSEDIIDIKWVVQYQVKDTREDIERYLYGLGDAEGIARAAAESAIRMAVGRWPIDTELTEHRRQIEDEVTASLQAALDECRCGLEVLYVGLLDVHAPPEVHWAFRDVASASEDKMKTVNEAEEYGERVKPAAEGGLKKRLAAADGKAAELVEHAKGRSAAFMARMAAYRESRQVTRLRLYFEKMDAVLPGLKKYVCLSQAIGNHVDLWLIDKDKGELSLPPLPPFGKQPGR